MFIIFNCSLNEIQVLIYSLLNFFYMRTLFSTLSVFMLLLLLSGTLVSAEDAPPLDSGQEVTLQSNDFVGSFTMHFTELKKGKPTKNSPTEITYYFNKNQVAFVPEAGKGDQTTMIYNLDNRMVTTLVNSDGEKTGMRMKMPKINIERKTGDASSYSLTPTEERKTIEGYACRKYLMETDEYTGHAWITEEAEINYGKLFDFLNTGQKNNKVSPPALKDLKGFAMETYTKSKKGNTEAEMKVTNLTIGKVDGGIFDTSDYNITDMSNLMNFDGR